MAVFTLFALDEPFIPKTLTIALNAMSASNIPFGNADNVERQRLGFANFVTLHSRLHARFVVPHVRNRQDLVLIQTPRIALKVFLNWIGYVVCELWGS